MEQLRVGDESYRFHRLDAAADPAPVHAADPARERPPQRLRGGGRGGRGLGRRRGALARDLLPPRARAAAGLHRRAGRRRPRGDARRDARAGRRPEGDQPADPGRARDRPLGAGGRVRLAARDRAQRRARVRAEPRALRLPPLGPGRLRQLPRRAAEHRHLPPGQPRVPRARRRGRATASPSPTRSSAPTRTRRWSTGSACSAGASAASRPRRRCSARRSRCSCRRSSASGSPARCARARRRPTSCSP